MAKISLAERGDRGTNIVINVLLIVAALVCLYPLWFVIIASVSSPTAIGQGEVILWPVGFNLDGYNALFTDEAIWIGYRNSLFYTAVGICWDMFLQIPVAYALSRKDLPGRKWITTVFLFTMYFSGGMIPTYVLISNLGLINNWVSIVFCGGVKTYNIIVARSFFMGNVPESLFDAARIDGCSYTRFFLKVVLPLSGAMLAIIALFNMQAHWNAYLGPQMYLWDEDKWTLQQVIKKIMKSMSQEDIEGVDPGLISMQERRRQLLKYTVVIAGALPMIIVYPFVQKHFVKGVMIGAVKG